MPRLLTTLSLCSLFSTIAYASASSTGPGYTAGVSSYDVYSVDFQSGATSVVANIPVSGTIGISLINSRTAYVVGLITGKVYELNLQNGAVSTVTPTPVAPPGDLFGIAVANNTTAYVVGINDNTVYSVNLQSGASSPVAVVPGNPGLAGLDMANNTTAYIVGENNSNVYRVNVENGTSTVVATIPGPSGLADIVLADYSTAYVAGANSIFKVNLQTGATSTVTTIAGSPALSGINVNGTTAYTVGVTDNTIFVVDLLTGSYYALATIPGTPTLDNLALLLQMPTKGLSGSNEKFAKYLNKNGPIDVIRSFALLDSGLRKALESAAPTRNAFATYASQNGYLASSQVVSDHLRQKRFHYRMKKNSNTALADIPADELLANASQKFRPPAKKNAKKNSKCNPCITPGPYTFWFSPFGEYAREKSQAGAPGFDMSLGGAIAAFDYNGMNDNVIGGGGAYSYTRVHDDSGAGHANVNQGFLTLYGTVNASKWYFDLGLWGGYYHIQNQRKISFTGVHETANSHTNGWQVAPHFEVGYDGYHLMDCGVKWFGLEPFLMGEWVANWERGFKEHGAGEYNMGQKGRFCSLVRGETGLRFHEIAQFDWGRMVFREKASYAYQKAFHTGSITAFLVGAPGTFTVSTLGTAQNLGVAEFSMLFIWNNSNAPYLDIRYQGEFGSRYQSHQGVIEIGKDF